MCGGLPQGRGIRGCDTRRTNIKKHKYGVGSKRMSPDGRANGQAEKVQAGPVYDGRIVAVQIDQSRQDLPCPALEDVVVHHLDLLAIPAWKVTNGVQARGSDERMDGTSADPCRVHPPLTHTP